jgi:hypothetical protein
VNENLFGAVPFEQTTKLPLTKIPTVSLQVMLHILNLTKLIK